MRFSDFCFIFLDSIILFQLTFSFYQLNGVIFILNETLFGLTLRFFEVDRLIFQTF